MIGDSDTDIIAGEKMGIESVKVDHKFNLKSALKKLLIFLSFFIINNIYVLIL